MAVGVGAIAIADVGSNFIAPEKAPVTVVLGENAARVGRAATAMGGVTFTEVGATFAETMTKTWRGWLITSRTEQEC